MSPDALIRHWRGLLLGAVGVVAVLHLGASDRLNWYIHPRYVWFTIIMAAIAALLIVGATLTLSRANARVPDPDGESAMDAEGTGRRSRNRRSLGAVGTGVLVACAAIALLVLPPAQLSAETAIQRQVNTAGLPGPASGASAAGPAAAPGDGEELTVRDWSLLLRQNGGADAEGRTASVLGFIVPDEQDPEAGFHVARFFVSCCAVDAQPIGVPVMMPDWQEAFSAGDWVRVDGTFMLNPDVTSAEQLLLAPASVSPAEAPDDPYVY